MRCWALSSPSGQEVMEHWCLQRGMQNAQHSSPVLSGCRRGPQEAIVIWLHGKVHTTIASCVGLGSKFSTSRPSVHSLHAQITCTYYLHGTKACLSLQAGEDTDKLAIQDWIDLRGTPPHPSRSFRAKTTSDEHGHLFFICPHLESMPGVYSIPLGIHCLFERLQACLSLPAKALLVQQPFHSCFTTGAVEPEQDCKA